MPNRDFRHQYSADLGRTLEFLRTIWELDHALQARSKAMARRHGTTGPQRLALRIVGRFPGISASQLAEVMHVHPSTLTGVLLRLEKQGLLSRKTAEEDRRRACFTLTAEGERFAGPSEYSTESAVQALLDRSTPEQVATAQRLIEDLSKELFKGTVAGAGRPG